jgi:hypothetical protein
MSSTLYESGPTSNDLLDALVDRHSKSALHYEIVAQSTEEVRCIDNAPAVSIGPYLLKSDQLDLLTVISIYSLRGESREQLRLLYMNSAAIRIWRQMGNTPKIVGAQFRPPPAATLAFGVPFSE